MLAHGIQGIEIVFLLLLLFVVVFGALARRLAIPYPIVRRAPGQATLRQRLSTDGLAFNSPANIKEAPRRHLYISGDMLPDLLSRASEVATVGLGFDGNATASRLAAIAPGPKVSSICGSWPCGVLLPSWPSTSND